MRAQDLTGQQFGNLIVLERDLSRKDRAYWICKCSCGKILSISGTRLRNGQKSCGCLNLSQLKGQQFGRLTAIRPTANRSSNGSIIWECKCSCGNTVAVRADALISGKTRSCGCLKLEQSLINLAQIPEDLTGNKYGKLIVLEQDLLRSKQQNRTYWTCLCDCGNLVSVRQDHLKTQSIASCGCQKQSAGEIIIENILKNNNIIFQKEYTFSDLKATYPLRFDFALFDKTSQELVCLIEFNGMQHYIETNYYFSDSLINIQHRDELKNSYCLEKNIPLFRVHYKQLSKLHNITDILNINNLVKENNYG